MKINILVALKNNFKKTGGWTLWCLIGGLFPVWGAFFCLKLFQKDPAFTDFTNNGELIIYAATILTTGMYLVLEDYRTSFFPGRKIFGLLSLICLFASTFIFSAIIAFNIENNRLIFDIDRDLILILSVVIFIISILLTLLINSIDRERTNIDYAAQAGKGLKKLEENFDKLEGE